MDCLSPVPMPDVLQRRAAHWHTVLHLYAYELAAPDRLDPIELRLRAIRAASHDVPRATIDVHEIWRAGRDPYRLMPTVEGHHLLRASWHAQIGGDGAACAERFDVDRSKPPNLTRHRHPYGLQNNAREQTTIAVPEAWMLHVETIISSVEDEAH
jgi:hypothetical protein